MRRLLLVATLVLFAAPHLVFAQQTLHVPGDYPSIQAAVDAAAPGDRVFIAAGVYRENLIVGKPIQVTGQDPRSVRIEPADPERPVVWVELDEGGVLFEGVRVSGGEIGIRIETGAKGFVRVLDSLFTENACGLDVRGEGAVLITRCLLVDNDVGVLAAGERTELIDTEILRGQSGIVLGGSGRVTISGCLVGLAERGVSRYTAGCGWGDGSATFSGTVTGQANRIYATSADLCPGAGETPWPERFVDEEWRAVIGEIVGAFNEGVDAFGLQHYADAADAYSTALSLFSTPNVAFPLLEGYVCEKIGAFDWAVGRDEEALAAYRSARSIYARREMEVDFAKADQSIGVINWALGWYEEALAAYRSARAVYLEREMDVDVATVDVGIGAVWFDVGGYEEALAAYRSARAVYGEWEMHIDVATVDQQIGHVHRDLERYEEALAAYRSARSVYDKWEMDMDVAAVDQHIGVVHHNLGQYEEALAAYRSARAVYLEREMDVDVATVDVGIGAVYRDLGRYEEALATYRSALVLLDALLSIEERGVSYPTRRWMLHFNMGIAHEGFGERARAVSSYEQSIAAIESIRERLSSDSVKLAWQERTRRVYERLIDLLYRMEQGASALPYVERCRARTFLDAVYGGGISPDQLVSVEAGLSTEGIDPGAIDEAIRVAQESLCPNEAVLEYMVTDTGVYVWAITTTQGVSDPIYVEYDREQLLRDVVALRRAIEPEKTVSDGEPALSFGNPTDVLKAFYGTLLKPALVQLDEDVDTLILIPSGPLWYVPFAALAMTDRPEIRIGGSSVAPKRPTYLVEEYTIAFLPSLASLPMLSEVETTSAGGYLAFANPTLSADQQTAVGAHYQHSVLETACRTFASQVGGIETDVHVQAEASETLAHSTSTGQRVLVYACHGDFNPSVPLASRLLLASSNALALTGVGEDRRLPDGDYHASEVLLTDHRGVDLVVLAACETLLPALREIQGLLGLTLGPESDDALTLEQLELIVAGDEVVGLSRSFLSSGARSVLGTLWQASADAVARLLVSLGEHHKAGLTWAEALCEGQRQLLTADAFADVWFWAPYQLIGAWR